MAEQQQKTIEPAADLYLQLEGVNGSVTEPGHEGWIKIQSLQFGAGVAISNAGGRRYNQSREEREAAKKKEEEAEAAAEKAAAERGGETEDERWERKVRSTVEVSSASLSEVTVTKETDASSPLLFHNTVLRKPVRRATIELVHRTDKSITRFTLDTVFVSSFSLSVGNRGSGRPTESFSLNFRHVDFSVAAADDVKAAVGYDLTTKEVHLNGEALKPFWPEKDDNDNDY